MDIKGVAEKVKVAFEKYKYIVVILIIGLVLLLIPEKSVGTTGDVASTPNRAEQLDVDSLSGILQSVEGAGKVQVLLSVASGEKTIYQFDQDSSGTGDSSNIKTETVIVSDSERNEVGLINQINPPVYLGAIVVCQGADSPAVKLAITQAVSKITGLSTEKVCVLKMK